MNLPALALAFLVALPAGPAPTPPGSRALEAQDARFSAMVAGDVARLSEMLDDSVTYHHSNGAVETKTQFLDAIRTGALRYVDAGSLRAARPPVSGSIRGGGRARVRCARA